MKFTALLVALLLSSGVWSVGAVIPEGTGIMYDARYCFMLTAPKGWVLDSSVMSGKGVCAVFYPKGGAWGESPVVFYVNTRERTAKVASAQDAADADMADERKNGSPKAKAVKIKEVKLKGGRVASIWEYTGDQWGNYERTAFVVEGKGISAVVMSARTKAEMDGANPAFEALVASYEYIGTAKIEK